MSLIKWEPFAEIESLQKEMNRLFEQFNPGRREHLFADDYVPAVELKNNDTSIDLKVELPGLAAEDIDIQVTPDAVSIGGERKTETKTEEAGMTRSEFYYGRFQRVIPLPVQVLNTDAEAEYKDGILTLHLPKNEAEQQKVVKVPISSTES